MTTGDEDRAQEALEEGNRLAGAGDFGGALAAYDRSLELRRDDANTHYNRGVTLSELGRHEEAVAAYDQALELRSDHANAHYNRGASLGRMGRNNDAFAAYERALDLRPDDPDTLNNLGNTLSRLHRHEEALAAYERALKLRADDPDIHYNQGVTLSELGRTEEALEAYDQALELRSDDANAHYNRGNALNDLHRVEEALAAYDRALGVRPDDPSALTNRGAMLERLGRYEEARAVTDRSLELRPGDPGTLNNRGVALTRLGRHRQAATSYQEAAEAFEKGGSPNAVPHANRGEALYRLGWFHGLHLQEAVKSFQQALELDGQNTRTRNALGICLLELGQPAAAAAEFLRAAEQALDDPDLRYNYAVACARQARTDRAKTELAQLLDEHPAHEPARRALDLLSALGEPDLWQWWTQRSHTRRALGIVLLGALALLVALPMLYLAVPSMDVPQMPWQYYVAALAVVSGALVLPAVRQLRAFGVELVQPPLRAFGVELVAQPLSLDDPQLEPVFRP